MTSTHRHPPPPPNSQNEFRLPSLKDLNFYRPTGAQPAPQQPENPIAQQEQPPSQPARHPIVWTRSAPIPYPPPPASAPAPPPPPTATHQQYHDVPPKVEYNSKHDNIPYPIQTNTVPVAVAREPVSHSHSPNQPKRQRTAASSTAASRDSRPSHVCFSFFFLPFTIY